MKKAFPRGSLFLLTVYGLVLLASLAAWLVPRLILLPGTLSQARCLIEDAVFFLSPALAVLCAVRYPKIPYVCILLLQILLQIIVSLPLSLPYSSHFPPSFSRTSSFVNNLLMALIPLFLIWLLSRGFLRLTRREFPAFALTSLVISLLNCWTLFFFIPEQPVKYLLYILLYTLLGFAVCMAVYGVAALIRRSRDKNAASPAAPDESLGDYLS